MKERPVRNRDDFVAYVRGLIVDLRQNPQDWENRNLETYLEGLASWVQDMDGYYENFGLEKPRDVNWDFMADVLSAASVYE
jgi:hypothetical protein